MSIMNIKGALQRIFCATFIPQQAAKRVPQMPNSNLQESLTAMRRQLQMQKDQQEAQNRHFNNFNNFTYIAVNWDGQSPLTPNAIKAAIAFCSFKALSRTTQEEIQAIRGFFKKISHLPENIFDRKKCLGGNEALQRLLSPELDQLLQDVEMNPSLKQNRQHQLNIAVAKAKLSVELGYGVSAAGGGVNGARIIKDFEGKALGVFKARQKLGWTDITQRIKNWFGQARLLNQQDEMGQQYAEVAAYHFNNAFKFQLAPEATMCNLKGEDGAFLVFLGGYQELKDCEQTLNSRSDYTKEELQKWQMVCVYNFLIGNMDPHNENIFVRMQEGKLADIRMIDHGNCFIERNPGAWGAKGNLGHWGTYNISQTPFQEDVKKFIKENVTGQNFNTFLEAVKKDHPEFFSEGIIILMNERFQVLKDGIQDGTLRSPAELSHVRSQQDFTEISKKHSAPNPTDADDTVIEIEDEEDDFIVLNF